MMGVYEIAIAVIAAISVLLVGLGVWAYRRMKRRQRQSGLITLDSITKDYVDEFENARVLGHLVDREWPATIQDTGTIRIKHPAVFTHDKTD